MEFYIVFVLQVDRLEEDISKKLEEHVEHDNKPIIMRKYFFRTLIFGTRTLMKMNLSINWRLKFDSFHQLNRNSC